MFRCTTELKGLIIDADSFEEEIYWHLLDVHYKFFFYYVRRTNFRKIIEPIRSRYSMVCEKIFETVCPQSCNAWRSLEKNATESYGNSVSFEKYTVLAECNGVSWRNHLDNR